MEEAARESREAYINGKEALNEAVTTYDEVVEAVRSHSQQLDNDREKIGTEFLGLGVQMGMLKARERFALEDMELSRFITAAAATKDLQQRSEAVNITIETATGEDARLCSLCAKYFQGSLLRIGHPGNNPINAIYLCGFCTHEVAELEGRVGACEVKQQWVVA